MEILRELDICSIYRRCMFPDSCSPSAAKITEWFQKRAGIAGDVEHFACPCIKCVNFDVCKTKIPQVMTCKYQELCPWCTQLFRTKLIFERTEKICPLCLSTKTLFVQHTSNCGHSFCNDCFKKAWCPEEPLPFKPSDYGYRKSCLCEECDEYYLCADKKLQWERECPEQYLKWKRDNDSQNLIYVTHNAALSLKHPDFIKCFICKPPLVGMRTRTGESGKLSVEFVCAPSRDELLYKMRQVMDAQCEAEEIVRVPGEFDTLLPERIQEIDPPPRRIDVIWGTEAVPKDVQCEAEGIVRVRGEFGSLPPERIQEIEDKLDHLPITLGQALSLRGALNQEKSVKCHYKLMRKAKRLSRKYDRGESVIALSKNVDAPPVNTFRAILTGRGWSKRRIYKTLNKHPEKLSKRDREQLELAESADSVSSVDKRISQGAAEIFENIVCDYFESLGVRFRRQEELIAEQKDKEGRAIITPDILFLDDVRINGLPCAWIDVKHFFGANVKFLRKKIQKQVKRYVTEYGHGGIVYRHGFCDGLHLEGAVQLDASILDLSPLHDFHQTTMNTL